MPDNQTTAAQQPRQEPFRWSRAEIASALDNFCDRDHPSQRQYAVLLGILTLGGMIAITEVVKSGGDLGTRPAERLLARLLCGSSLVVRHGSFPGRSLGGATLGKRAL